MRRFALLLACACGGSTPQGLTITVNPDGTFSPDVLEVRAGDTVEWILHDRTDAIVAGQGCDAPDAFDATALTGPLPRAASGLFVLGPDGPGLTGVPYAVMDATLADPDVSGVFIRLRWNEVHLGPDQFDFSVMDREIARAVAHGKLYNIGFKAGSAGTPAWIFDEGVTPLEFRDTGSGPECTSPPCCGARMTLGSPADPEYRAHYFALLEAVAAHISARADWMRALAYVKPSGANLFSHENRLPDGCTCGCDVCNPAVWATQGDYTPEALYDFYRQQEALIAELFPGKTMVYALIQAGFPKVTSETAYETCPLDPAVVLPRGTEQTEAIIMQGQAAHGVDFAVMHNGLGPLHEPNRWVLQAAKAGSVTGFQTQNTKELSTTAELEQTLTNLVDNTDGVFLEIYEELLQLKAQEGKSFASWAETLHARRRDDWASLGDPYPTVHRHTFTTPGTFRYFHASRCTTGEISVVEGQ